MHFFIICSSCLLIIGEISLEQGLLSQLFHLLCWFVSPGNVAEPFWKETPPPRLWRSHLASFLTFKFENGNIPSSTACGCKLLIFVISQLLLSLIPSSSYNASQTVLFLQGWILYYVEYMEKGPCCKWPGPWNGLLLFPLFLLLF